MAWGLLGGSVTLVARALFEPTTKKQFVRLFAVLVSRFAR